jgi:hypothetical protein
VHADVDAVAADPNFSGGGGIRTRGPLARTLVFKTSAFDRSATPPGVAGPMLAADAGAYRVYTAASACPGEVAEWLKALAC